jgi:hypothetical protein
VGSVSFGTNVDANDPSQDTYAGQADGAIAAAEADGQQRVLAAWSDATGSVSGVYDTTLLAASLTGVGFSTDGGRSFADLIGLPNPNPNQQWFPGPSVVALDGRHFLVVSLYYPRYYHACENRRDHSQNTAAVAEADVDSAGNVTFHRPVIFADTGDVCSLYTPNPDPDLAFIDHPIASFDPTTRTLAIAYGRVYFMGTGGPHSGFGQIELVRAHVPSQPHNLAPSDFGPPIVVWGEETALPSFGGTCERPSETSQCGALNTGSTVAINDRGDAYVAWERNILTNLPGFEGGDPYVYIHAALVPSEAGGPTIGGKNRPVVISRGQPNGNADGGVLSMDTVKFAGNDDGGGNDFPHLAFNPAAGEVEAAWNDRSLHVQGDIWLRPLSLDLRHLGTTRMVNDLGDSTLHYLPALSAGVDGSISVSWYDRRLGGPDSAVTDLFGEVRPRASVNATDIRITTGSTNWSNMGGALIIRRPSFIGNVTAGGVTYFIWTDGRIGVPQPFVDSLPH